MQCKLCRREMGSTDPIYRVSVAYSINTRDISHGGVFEVCAECCATKPGVEFRWLTGHQWRSPEPCKRCGRPVISDMQRKQPKHVVCSDQCRRAVYNAMQVAKR